MRKIIPILITLMILSSCGSTRNKRVITKKQGTITSNQSKKQNNKSVTNNNKAYTKNSSNAKHDAVPSKVQSIIYNAEQYQGTRYKYGGTTKRGMDCSGLIHTAFKEDNIKLPRASSAMATYGDWIDLKTVKVGDLLFFATKKNSRTVNHVGLVTAINGDDVAFIHASTSQGVMTSRLKEKYWYFAFVQARRVL